MHRSVCLLLLLLTALPAAGAVYTWVDAQGVRHYSDIPKDRSARTADIPGLSLSDGNPDALADLQRRLDQASSAASRNPVPTSREPEVRTPMPGAVIRTADGRVPVEVAIDGAPELQADEALRYYLDGQSVADEPTRSTRIELGNVAPGRHALQVALWYQGQEIRRSGTTRFDVLPADTDARPGAGTVDGDTTAAPSGASPGQTSPAADSVSPVQPLESADAVSPRAPQGEQVLPESATPRPTS